MPRQVDYAMFVEAALQTFANSANDLYHGNNIIVQVRRINDVITLYVNRIPVCQVKVEGL